MIKLNGKPAVRVNAFPVAWGATDESRLYNIGGDEKWIAKKYSDFRPNKGEERKMEPNGKLIIEKWLYNKIFPE